MIDLEAIRYRVKLWERVAAPTEAAYPDDKPTPYDTLRRDALALLGEVDRLNGIVASSDRVAAMRGDA